MKKTMLIIIILILLPILIQAKPTEGKEDMTFKILEDLDADYVRGDISANQMIYEKSLDLHVLEKIGCDIMENLDMEEMDKLSKYEKNYNQINFYGYDEDSNQLSIILSSFYNEDTKKGKTYLYISFVNKEHFFNISGIIENIEYIFNNYQVEAEITTNIQGTIDKVIDTDEYTNRVESSIKSLNGRVLSTYQDDNLISYTGYTNSIENHIKINNEKINLNIAIRCNKTDNRTVIYIGTPIIAGGY